MRRPVVGVIGNAHRFEDRFTTQMVGERNLRAVVEVCGALPLMFAGSLAGITQTAPLAIYERFATDFEGALELSAVLVAVSAAILLSVKFVEGSALRHG